MIWKMVIDKYKNDVYKNVEININEINTKKENESMYNTFDILVIEKIENTLKMLKQIYFGIIVKTNWATYILEYGNNFNKYNFNTIRLIPLSEITNEYTIKKYEYKNDNDEETENNKKIIYNIINEKQNIYCKEKQNMYINETITKENVDIVEKKNTYNNLYFVYYFLYKINIFKENEKYESYEETNFYKKIEKRYNNIYI
jgi:hypothetical protein